MMARKRALHAEKCAELGWKMCPCFYCGPTVAAAAAADAGTGAAADAGGGGQPCTLETMDSCACAACSQSPDQKVERIKAFHAKTCGEAVCVCFYCSPPQAHANAAMADAAVNAIMDSKATKDAICPCESCYCENYLYQRAAGEDEWTRMWRHQSYFERKRKGSVEVDASVPCVRKHAGLD